MAILSQSYLAKKRHSPGGHSSLSHPEMGLGDTELAEVPGITQSWTSESFMAGVGGEE